MTHDPEQAARDAALMRRMTRYADMSPVLPLARFAAAVCIVGVAASLSRLLTPLDVPRAVVYTLLAVTYVASAYVLLLRHRANRSARLVFELSPERRSAAFDRMCMEDQADALAKAKGATLTIEPADPDERP